MTPDTCALLAQIFPVILLTLAIESGRVAVKIRQRRWWADIVVVPSVAFALMGLVLAVVSAASGGATSVVGVALWVLFGLSVSGMALLLLAILATDQIDAERAALTPAHSDESRLLDWLRRPSGS